MEFKKYLKQKKFKPPFIKGWKKKMRLFISLLELKCGLLVEWNFCSGRIWSI